MKLYLCKPKNAIYFQESLDDLLESYTCPNCSQPILPSQGIIHKDCSCHELTDSALADEKYQSACRDLHKMANYRQEQNISYNMEQIT